MKKLTLLALVLVPMVGQAGIGVRNGEDGTRVYHDEVPDLRLVRPINVTGYACSMDIEGSWVYRDSRYELRPEGWLSKDTTYATLSEFLRAAADRAELLLLCTRQRVQLTKAKLEVEKLNRIQAASYRASSQTSGYGRSVISQMILWDDGETSRSNLVNINDQRERIHEVMERLFEVTQAKDDFRIVMSKLPSHLEDEVFEAIEFFLERDFTIEYTANAQGDFLKVRSIEERQENPRVTFEITSEGKFYNNWRSGFEFPYEIELDEANAAVLDDLNERFYEADVLGVEQDMLSYVTMAHMFNEFEVGKRHLARLNSLFQGIYEDYRTANGQAYRSDVATAAVTKLDALIKSMARYTNVPPVIQDYWVQDLGGNQVREYTQYNEQRDIETRLNAIQSHFVRLGYGSFKGGDLPEPIDTYSPKGCRRIVKIVDEVAQLQELYFQYDELPRNILDSGYVNAILDAMAFLSHYKYQVDEPDGFLHEVLPSWNERCSEEDQAMIRKSLRRLRGEK